jgi:hypothetical protein
MNAQSFEIEPRVMVEIEADDHLCSLDDLISQLEHRIRATAQDIAAKPDQGAFDRLVDQQTRLADAFTAARRHIVDACEQRSRDRLARTMTFARSA